MKNILIIIMMGCCSCSKFITVDPPYTSTSTDLVFSKDATAAAALSAIYTQFANHDDAGIGQGVIATSVTLGIYADEMDKNEDNGFTFGNQIIVDCWKNQLTPLISTQFLGWDDYYNSIYKANAAIEGLKASSTLSLSVRQQLLGEAYFLRGFLNFYLVNFYGDIPLPLSTDYKVNTILSRTSQELVYAQIIRDLLLAEELLQDNYIAADAISITAERIRPNKSVAQSMLAKVYLFTKDYPNAEKFASKVIEKSATYSLISLDDVFLANNQEAIWQFRPVSPLNGVTGTPEGSTFLLKTSPPINIGSGPDYIPSNFLLNSFEEGDMRREKWIGYEKANNNKYYYFINKYKNELINATANQKEYSMVIRLAEIILIRAEARAMQNNISGAQEDINGIRHRAGLDNTLASSQSALVDTILKERMVELFAEWGNRFMDLKRLGKLDEILGMNKSQYWKPYNKYFPIPQSERDAAPNLSQNEGY